MKKNRNCNHQQESPARDMEITITVEDALWHALSPELEQEGREVITRVLESHWSDSWSSVALACVLTNDASVHKLNAAYRHQDKPTNILSFAADENPLPGHPLLLGDLILARETTCREAEEQRKEPMHHVRHLLVHGCLHLLGYDHEEDQDAAIMETEEVAILNRLGVPDPYQDPYQDQES